MAAAKVVMWRQPVDTMALRTEVAWHRGPVFALCASEWSLLNQSSRTAKKYDLDSPLALDELQKYIVSPQSGVDERGQVPLEQVRMYTLMLDDGRTRGVETRNEYAQKRKQAHEDETRRVRAERRERENAALMSERQRRQQEKQSEDSKLGILMSVQEMNILAAQAQKEEARGKDARAQKEEARKLTTTAGVRIKRENSHDGDFIKRRKQDSVGGDGDGVGGVGGVGGNSDDGDSDGVGDEDPDYLVGLPTPHQRTSLPYVSRYGLDTSQEPNNQDQEFIVSYYTRLTETDSVLLKRTLSAGPAVNDSPVFVIVGVDVADEQVQDSDVEHQVEVFVSVNPQEPDEHDSGHYYFNFIDGREILSIEGLVLSYLTSLREQVKPKWKALLADRRSENYRLSNVVFRSERDLAWPHFEKWVEKWVRQLMSKFLDEVRATRAAAKARVDQEKAEALDKARELEIQRQKELDERKKLADVVEISDNDEEEGVVNNVDEFGAAGDNDDDHGDYGVGRGFSTPPPTGELVDLTSDSVQEIIDSPEDITDSSGSQLPSLFANRNQQTTPASRTISLVSSTSANSNTTRPTGSVAGSVTSAVRRPTEGTTSAPAVVSPAVVSPAVAPKPRARVKNTPAAAANGIVVLPRPAPAPAAPLDWTFTEDASVSFAIPATIASVIMSPFYQHEKWVDTGAGKLYLVPLVAIREKNAPPKLSIVVWAVGGNLSKGAKSLKVYQCQLHQDKANPEMKPYYLTLHEVSRAKEPIQSRHMLHNGYLYCIEGSDNKRNLTATLRTEASSNNESTLSMDSLAKFASEKGITAEQIEWENLIVSFEATARGVVDAALFGSDEALALISKMTTEQLLSDYVLETRAQEIATLRSEHQDREVDAVAHYGPHKTVIRWFPDGKWGEVKAWRIYHPLSAFRWDRLDNPRQDPRPVEYPFTVWMDGNVKFVKGTEKEKNALRGGIFTPMVPLTPPTKDGKEVAYGDEWIQCHFTLEESQQEENPYLLFVYGQPLRYMAMRKWDRDIVDDDAVNCVVVRPLIGEDDVTPETVNKRTCIMVRRAFPLRKSDVANEMRERTGLTTKKCLAYLQNTWSAISTGSVEANQDLLVESDPVPSTFLN